MRPVAQQNRNAPKAAPPPAALPKARPSRLGKTIAGRLAGGLRFAFYGSESVGKTSLAAASPDPIFFDCEDGSGNLNVQRYAFRDEEGGHVPRTFDEVLDAVEDLRTADHGFRTLVIDTVDKLEALLWQWLCVRDSGKVSNLNKSGRRLESIESYGFGKGYQLAIDVWRDLCNRLDRLRSEKGMNIILLGHASIRTFKNPEGEDYDRYHLRLNEKAAGLVKEWCDILGFCTFEEGGAKLDPEEKKAKAFSTGRRLIKLERTGAYDAKHRIAMPSEVLLDIENPWGPLQEAIDESRLLTPEELMKLIRTELLRIGDAQLADQVESACAEVRGDTGRLSQYLNKLKTR